MATRFYLPLSGAAPSSPTVDAGWERSIGAFARYKAVTTPVSSALANIAALHGATTTDQTCWHQWVSDTLDVDQSISGTISMVVRVLEGAPGEDAHLAFSARVIAGDGTVRGTLLLQHATSVEFPGGTAATRSHNALAISTVAALAGDRVVIEIGTHCVTAANATNITFRFGDSAASDFALSDGLTTDLNPWVELSTTLTFGPIQPTLRRRGGVPHTTVPGHRFKSGRMWGRAPSQHHHRRAA